MEKELKEDKKKWAIEAKAAAEQAALEEKEEKDK